MKNGVRHLQKQKLSTGIFLLVNILSKSAPSVNHKNGANHLNTLSLYDPPGGMHGGHLFCMVAWEALFFIGPIDFNWTANWQLKKRKD